jgi:predicted exporter
VSQASHPRHRVFALLWLVAMAALAWHQWQLWRNPAFTTDVTELLPHQPDPELEQATARLLAAATRQWVVLVGAADWERSKQAAAAALAQLDPGRARLQDAGGESLPTGLLATLQRARGALLTPQSREWLRTASSEQVGQRALQNLLQPIGDGFSSWREDPLGLWGEWLRERAQWSSLRPRDGWLWIADGGIDWIALPFAEEDTAFSSWSKGENSRRLALARAAVLALGSDVRVLAGGSVLQAEAAAQRARLEVTVIGTGSLVAVILLTFLTFGSLRPILLVTLSLVIGCAAALSVTQLVFGEVHLLTTVFGASLVGVAEDYGIHYFAARQGRPVAQRWEQLRQIAPGLWLALATSGIAYLALGLAPFPGIRQIAVFSCVGLTAAFLTVLCWFPFLDRQPLRTTAFAARFAGTLDRWPRWPRGRTGLVLAVAGSAVLAGGLAQLRSVDDVRALQSAPPRLMAEQIEVGRILGLASPAQVYLVSGADSDELLRNEEALTARLAALAQAGTIGGHQALSDWVPAAGTQRANTALVANANRAAWRALAAATGESIDIPAQAPALLTAADLAPVAQGLPAIGAWQGPGGRQFTLVMLQAVTRAALPALAQAATGLAGVRFIDNTARYSQLLSHYRVRLSGLLLLGLAAVVLLLQWRYGRHAWRAWLPTVLGGVFTLACFGWAGVPMQLFVVLALMLLLGMGIDYGIFMQEHPGERSVWLAVAIAGISTLLAFGLLALSTTPALRAFGLAMLIGETAIWLLTPVFRAESLHS